MLRKKIILPAVIAIASILSFSGCSEDSGSSTTAKKPLSEITADVMGCGVEFPDMVEVTEENFQLKYTLTADDYEEYSLRWSGSGANADEICIIKAKDKDKVKTAVTNRLEGQKTAFKDYVPAEYDKLCKTEVKTIGDYVYWLCTNDNSKSEKALKDCFE